MSSRVCCVQGLTLQLGKEEREGGKKTFRHHEEERGATPCAAVRGTESNQQPTL